MKKFLKHIMFPDPEKQKIFSGPAKGMYIKYDVNHRFQHLMGIYEKEIYPYLKKGMERSDTLVDVGANDGYYVLVFLKTGKKVIACEPGQVALELKYNAELNGYYESDNFIIERRLIGSDPGSLRVEDLVKKHSGNLFFLVDIDGGEYDLLNSCGETFDHNSASWLIETHSRELENECVDYLTRRKYKVSIIKNSFWRKIVPEKRPLEHNRWLYAEPALPKCKQHL